MKEVRVAMLGFGGIARTHKVAYELLAKEGYPVRVVAACDVNPEQFTSATQTNLGGKNTDDLTGVALFENVDEMMHKIDFDMADICVPSYLHKQYAVQMMEAGKHVLSEKPMALTSADCEEMLRVSEKTGRLLMIGQCLRFEPAYLYLKKCVDEGTFGKLKNLFMDRLSVYPMWGFEKWYCDTEKSGGCIMDLHIHDIDMARFLLGNPEAVSAVSYDGISRWQVVNSRLYYPKTMVVATGSWDESATTPFSFSYRARFEQASLISNGSKVMLYPDEGEPMQVELPKVNRMAEEIRKIVSMILDPTVKNESNPPESACQSVRLIEVLRKSADCGGEKIVLDN